MPMHVVDVPEEVTPKIVDRTNLEIIWSMSDSVASNDCFTFKFLAV